MKNIIIVVIIIAIIIISTFSASRVTATKQHLHQRSANGPSGSLQCGVPGAMREIDYISVAAGGEGKKELLYRSVDEEKKRQPASFLTLFIPFSLFFASPVDLILIGPTPVKYSADGCGWQPRGWGARRL